MKSTTFLASLLSLTLSVSAVQYCGSRGLPACPSHQVCVDQVPNGMAVDKAGICVDDVFCGGFAGIDCDGKCVDDPRDDCDPNNGGSDCGGICITKRSTPPAPTPTHIRCGSKGLANCPKGQSCCVSNLSPCFGAKDCPGVCGEVCALDFNPGGPISTFNTVVKEDPVATAILPARTSVLECGLQGQPGCPNGLSCCRDISCMTEEFCSGVCAEVCALNAAPVAVEAVAEPALTSVSCGLEGDAPCGDGLSCCKDANCMTEGFCPGVCGEMCILSASTFEPVAIREPAPATATSVLECGLQGQNPCPSGLSCCKDISCQFEEFCPGVCAEVCIQAASPAVEAVAARQTTAPPAPAFTFVPNCGLEGLPRCVNGQSCCKRPECMTEKYCPGVCGDFCPV